MAETSGFQTDLPQSAYLSLSIERAISMAKQRSHRYVTLEHLLFALMDDPAAKEILEGLRADISGIRGNISETVNRGLTALYTPGEFDLHASYKVERVLQTASDDADRLNCEELDAAFVIAALVRETDNYATGILKRNGVAYGSAVSWLYANRGATSPPSRKQSRQSAEIDGSAGAPPMDQPEPSPAPRVPASSAPVRAPAAAAPARERYAASPVSAEAGEALPSGKDEHGKSEPGGHAQGELIELEYKVGADSPPPPLPEKFGPVRQPLGEDAPQVRGPGQTVPRGRGRSGRIDVTSEELSAPPPGAQARGRPAPAANGKYSGYRGGDAGPPAPPRAPAAAEAQAEPPVPPVSRLDEMRLGKARAPQLPVPVPAPRQKKAAPAKSRRARSGDAQQKRQRRPLRPHEALLGRVVENIPRRMRAAVRERIEVRISREDTNNLLRGLEGRGAPVAHEALITQTMSVALRAPDGGFTIEPLSPETQWIFDRPDEAELYGRWRWVVTPHKSGQRRLQLLIASRSIGPNGIAGDTALPDQTITVHVRTNYWLTMARAAQWIAAMVVGGVLTELAMVGTRFFGL